MKRETYKITSNTGIETAKFKWNSAIRETESLIGAIAKDELANYKLVDSVSIKGDCGHVKGSRTWQGSNGKTVIFTIEKQ